LIFPRKSGRENGEIVYNTTEEEDNDKEAEVYA
jgi:hypothetical protein